jgi:hypothetical protein
METRFTPGPWTCRQAKTPIDGEYDFGIFANGVPGCVAEAFGRTSETHRPDAEANAHLIAAAPDLFVHAAAAERGITEAVRILDLMGRGQAARDLAIYANNLRAALHKALGETQ